MGVGRALLVQHGKLGAGLVCEGDVDARTYALAHAASSVPGEHPPDCGQEPAGKKPAGEHERG